MISHLPFPHLKGLLVSSALLFLSAGGALPRAQDPQPSPAAAEAASPQDPAAMMPPADSIPAGNPAPAAVPGQMGKVRKIDSGTVDTAGLRTNLYEYIAHPILQTITLPVDWVLVPVARTLIWPLKDPLRYFLRENIIDRTIQLVSFGEKEQVMLYPTLNLAQGTGSYTGLTLRHTALFGRPEERLVAMGNIYVNGDWKFRSYLSARTMLGSEWDGRAVLQLNRMKNASMNQPGTNRSWYYADTSNVYYVTLARPIFHPIGLRMGATWRQNHYAVAPPQEDTLESDFFRNAAGLLDPKSRGLEKNWNDFNVVLGFGWDTRNNENIPLTGSDGRMQWHYHFTDAGHDYHAWDAVWSGYFKLGEERYEITAAEERAAGGMDIGKILKQIELRKLREQMLNRKVVAVHLYAAQSFEVPDNRMPVYGLATLGNGTPMRGYSGSRFRDYTVASAGAEYRFPVMRLLDGVIFNEYGVFGRSWEKIDYLGSLRNSWGFGIRVRRPDIFLFRTELGFHGLHGILVNLSVDAAY